MRILRLNLTTMAWQIFLLLITVSQSLASSFIRVQDTCKYWEPVSIYSNGQETHMHCILDDTGQLGVVNTTWILVSEGMCPYFNRHSGVIDTKVCNWREGKCPGETIQSYGVTEYDGCLIEKESGAQIGEKPDPCTCEHYKITVAVFATVTLIMLAGAGARAVVILRKRKQNFPDATSQRNQASNQEEKKQDTTFNDLRSLQNDRTSIQIEGLRNQGTYGNYSELACLLLKHGQDQQLKKTSFSRHAADIFKIFLSVEPTKENSSTRDKDADEPGMLVVKEDTVPSENRNDDSKKRNMTHVKEGTKEETENLISDASKQSNANESE